MADDYTRDDDTGMQDEDMQRGDDAGFQDDDDMMDDTDQGL